MVVVGVLLSTEKDEWVVVLHIGILAEAAFLIAPVHMK